MSCADGGTFLARAQESTKETPVPLIYPPSPHRQESDLIGAAPHHEKRRSCHSDQYGIMSIQSYPVTKAAFPDQSASKACEV